MGSLGEYNDSAFRRKAFPCIGAIGHLDDVPEVDQL